MSELVLVSSNKFLTWDLLCQMLMVKQPSLNKNILSKQHTTYSAFYIQTSIISLTLVRFGPTTGTASFGLRSPFFSTSSRRGVTVSKRMFNWNHIYHINRFSPSTLFKCKWWINELTKYSCAWSYTVHNPSGCLSCCCCCCCREVDMGETSLELLF